MRLLRRGLRYALVQIDSESVRPYQRIIYFLYLAGGIWAAITGLPGIVDLALGHDAGRMWIVLLIAAPALTYMGQGLERFGGHKPSRSLAAFILQLTGDCGVMFASYAFTAAMSSTIWAGRAVFAAWAVFGLGCCALAMMIRGVRKLLAGVRAAREILGSNE